ncbi:GDSL-type esterase/lipase family protein [Streptomyces hesseae]|uniref:GDSL-type esterase/lipase family protein n=1 Tax=Streptomyces hesseae TaxID=3075519 RepID=A0ABU2SLE4_9ACTN|nr:GDSL-type esterase/lipase family protein [Streptomyces sp. DSM 40473]MDT0448709.1 GDSL-type esterase/lipase family protein [Streptomyces sp. DSM 40473]
MDVKIRYRPRRGLAARLAAPVLAAALIPTLVTAAPAVADPTPVAADWKVPRLSVMPLGDSITWGVGSSKGDGYRVALRDRLAGHADDLRFVGSVQRNGQDNEGHSGWQIDDLSENVEQWLAAARPNVVLLNIGTNDMDRDTDAPGAPARLGHLVDQITTAAPGVTVLVSSLVPHKDHGSQQRVDAYNAAIPGLVAERRAKGASVGYVSMGAVTAPGDFYDRLHPNDSGFAKMTDAFYQGVAKAAADGWIRQAVDVKPAPPRPVPRGDYRVDIDGDGKADYVVVERDGTVRAWRNRGGGRDEWDDLGRIATGVPGASGRDVRFADIDGDGKADYLVVGADGSLRAWRNDGGGRDAWTALGLIATGTGVPGADVRLADLDGDRKADYIALQSDGSVRAWHNGDGRGGWTGLGTIAKADYVVVDDDNGLRAWRNAGGDGHGGWPAYGRIATGLGNGSSGRIRI